MVVPEPTEPVHPAGRGVALGLLAVFCFSLTSVATRAAIVGGLPPFFVAVGRTFGAALLALPCLVLTRQPWPTRAQLRPLLAVIFGTVLGFPLLATWALAKVPSSHAGAVLGLLPLATSVVGAIRGRERLPALFWASAVAGSGVVVAFTWSQGGGRLEAADLALLAAVVVAGVGYTEGALLSRTLGGWQTISWALVLAAPLTGALLLGQLLHTSHGGIRLDLVTKIAPGAWLGMIYVTAVSQFLGFFPWYRGLALGGVARVGQLQLFQAPLTIVFSAWLLGESITPATAGTAALVLVTVAVGRWVAHGPSPNVRSVPSRSSIATRCSPGILHDGRTRSQDPAGHLLVTCRLEAGGSADHRPG